MSWIVAPDGVIETSVVPEIYVESIGAIELVGGNLRFWLTTEEASLQSGVASHRVVVAKIVAPLAIVPEAIGQLAQCLCRCADTLPTMRYGKPQLVT